MKFKIVLSFYVEIMSGQKVQTDRGICKFFVLNKCRRGDSCQWEHTKNQCDANDCEVYTNHKLCYKCNKKQRVAKKSAYDKRLRDQGYPCSNNWTDRSTGEKGFCENYTLRGDYCQSCYEEASRYIVGPCRNRDCSNRVMGGRGYCQYCQ